jgi:hypothetical protein
VTLPPSVGKSSSVTVPGEARTTSGDFEAPPANHGEDEPGGSMHRALVCVGAVMVLATATAWRQRTIDAAKERPIVEKTIHDNIAWALTKDRALAERTMAHDAALFIFNPDSTPTIGWDELTKNFEFWQPGQGE